MEFLEIASSGIGFMRASDHWNLDGCRCACSGVFWYILVFLSFFFPLIYFLFLFRTSEIRNFNFFVFHIISFLKY